MLFNSFQYLLFLPTVVALFWLAPRAWRLPMLLLASYGFYMCWIPGFILLILPMTVVNFFWGRLLYRFQGGDDKLVLSAGIAFNLLLLGIFKYANFFIGTVNSTAATFSHHDPGWAAHIILPLGISFFTFEFIHYLFEIHRGQKPIDSFVLFALFAAFFPTQIAGPIKRYPDFAAQMQVERKLSLSYFDQGLPLIIIGLAKKLLLADNLSVLVQMGMSNPGSFGALELWLFMYAFAFQIYFDFSGYTDIGRGSAMLFGYHIPINFNLPYIASNISDFWRRWHISLSTWLRDYLFIPLGGSRGQALATNRNLLITMTLGGLWHGASWNFVIWGVYHGICLIVHREFSAWRNTQAALEKLWQSKFWHIFSILLTFHAVCLGWVFFRLQNTRWAFLTAKRMLLFHPLYAPIEHQQFLIFKSNLPVIVPVTVLLLFALLACNLPLSFLQESKQLKNIPAPLKAAFCSLLIVIMITFLPDNSKPFIYFQF